MKFYLVQGTNPLISGVPSSLFASQAETDADAAELVNILRRDVADGFSANDEIQALMDACGIPDELPAANRLNWKDVLRQVQVVHGIHEFDLTEPDEVLEHLAGRGGYTCPADVWVEEFEVEVPALPVDRYSGPDDFYQMATWLYPGLDSKHELAASLEADFGIPYLSAMPALAGLLGEPWTGEAKSVAWAKSFIKAMRHFDRAKWEADKAGV